MFIYYVYILCLYIVYIIRFDKAGNGAINKVGTENKQRELN